MKKIKIVNGGGVNSWYYMQVGMVFDCEDRLVDGKFEIKDPRLNETLYVEKEDAHVVIPTDDFLEMVKDYCEAYDEEYGRYPEHEYEGESVYAYIKGMLENG